MGAGEKLGLHVDVEEYPNSTALPIRGVEVGPAQTWNDSNPRNRIRIGDCILEVNGEDRDPQKMLQMCRSALVLRIKLVQGSHPSMRIPGRISRTRSGNCLACSGGICSSK